MQASLDLKLYTSFFSEWMSSGRHWNQDSWDGGAPAWCKSGRCCHWCQSQELSWIKRKHWLRFKGCALKQRAEREVMSAVLNSKSLHRMITTTNISEHGDRSRPDHLLVHMHLNQIKVCTSFSLPSSSHYLIYMINFLCHHFSILSNILEVQNSILKRIYKCRTKAISRKDIIPSITSKGQKLLNHKL